MYTCQVCDYNFQEYDVRYNSRNDNYTCYDCLKRKKMSERTEDLLLRSFRKNQHRAVGFEIEACFTNTNGWNDPGSHYVQRIYEDTSIIPDNRTDETAEICTQPLYNLNDLKVVLKAINKAGGYVNDSCGGHIHIDARDLSNLDIDSNDDMLAVTHLWREIQAGFYALCSPKRVAKNIYPFEGNYCLANTINNNTDFWDRYKALNVSALEKHTLEFRFWEASLDFTILKMRAELCRKFVSYAAKQISNTGTYLINEQHKNKKYWCTSRKSVPTPEKFVEKIKSNGIDEIEKMCSILQIKPIEKVKLINYHKQLWKNSYVEVG